MAVGKGAVGAWAVGKAPIMFVGGIEYTITPSGTITYSGSTIFNTISNIIPNGSIVYTGNNLLVVIKIILSTGDMSFSGQAILNSQRTLDAYGTIDYSGTGNMYSPGIGSFSNKLPLLGVGV